MRKFIALCLGAVLALAPVSAVANITQIAGSGTGNSISNVTYSGTSPNNATTTADIPPGSLAAALVQTYDSTPTLGCSDSYGNTWQSAPNGSFRASAGTQIWYSYTVADIPNGGTISCTSSPVSGGFTVQILAFKGTDRSPYDVSPTAANGSGTSITVGPSPALSCPGGGTGCEVCVTGTIWNSLGNMTPDATWTYTMNTTTGTSWQTGFKIVSATTALSYTGSTSATGPFAGAMACFKASFSFRNRSLSGVGR